MAAGISVAADLAVEGQLIATDPVEPIRVLGPKDAAQLVGLVGAHLPVVLKVSLESTADPVNDDPEPLSVHSSRVLVPRGSRHEVAGLLFQETRQLFDDLDEEIGNNGLDASAGPVLLSETPASARQQRVLKVDEVPLLSGRNNAIDVIQVLQEIRA